MDASSDDTSGGGDAGALLALLVPISIPAASERVTAGFEIGGGSVEVELEVAFGVEPISIPAASERVTTGFELGAGSVEDVALDVAFGVVPISIPPAGGFASAVVAWDI